MKVSSLIGIASLAVSALASPILNGVTDSVDNLVQGDAGKAVDLNNGADLVSLLEGAIEGIKDHTGAINSTVGKVQSGDISKDQGSDDVIGQIKGIHLDLTKIVSSLTASAGIPVAPAQVDRVLYLLNILVNELLATVNTLVTVLGLRPQLTSLLHSVFSLVANILTLLIGLLSGLVPGLVTGLSPLLATLGNGVLAPILTPIVALLASLSGP